MKIVLLILIAAISYILGSLNGPVLISKNILHRDIRKTGIWNPGYGTFMDSYGVKGVAFLAVFDIVKTLIAVILGGLLLNVVEQPILGKLFATFCLLLGHNYPFLYLFKGGKGLICGGVALFVIDWRAGLICWAIFALVLIFSKYFALSACVAAILSPVLMWIFKASALEGAIMLLCAIVIIIRYAENIVRIFGGTEPALIGSQKSPTQDYGEE